MYSRDIFYVYILYLFKTAQASFEVRFICDEPNLNLFQTNSPSMIFREIVHMSSISSIAYPLFNEWKMTQKRDFSLLLSLH